MSNWEYMILGRQKEWQWGGKENWYWVDDKNLSARISERLNQLGQEGWELVNTITYSERNGDHWAGITTYVEFYLKRSK